MQVEAQPGASDYKHDRQRRAECMRTRDLARIRFTVTAQGTDVYDAVIQIVNTES